MLTNVDSSGLCSLCIHERSVWGQQLMIVSKGKLIALSGIDSSGKSTQIINIVNYLPSSTVRWSRGGYTPLFNTLKAIMRKSPKIFIPDAGYSIHRDTVFQSPMISRIWLMASILDLIIYYGIWYRILLTKKSLIADRYIWDTLIDFKINFPKFNIESWFFWRMLIKVYKKPDISIILTLSPEISIARSIKKNEPFMESIKIRKTRIDFYQKMIQSNKWVYIIDGSQSRDDVWNEILKALE